jgi:hypothetical protein
LRDERGGADVSRWAFDSADPVESFKALLRDLVKRYEFDVEGLYMKDGSIRPLPREAAVVGKVLEVSIKEYLSRQLLQVNDLRCIAASSDRTYPDFTFNGSLIHPHRFAVDLKCARRKDNGTHTRSPITIGTFNAKYFRRPDEKLGNIMMPYASYTAHLAVIAVYDYVDATARNVGLMVVEKWRVATRRRSSTTRCYIAAPSRIEDLRSERGDFSSKAEFEAFWRSHAV